jgi:hypothetical protein
MSSVTTAALRDLIDHLAGPAAMATAKGDPGEMITWRQWQITPIEGGRNGRVFRATSPEADLAVKLTARDWPNRAGREYRALQVLEAAGLEIAPRPLLLESDRYESQVIVMTWLDGTVSREPPATDADWRRLVEHLLMVHTITPLTTSTQFPEGVLSMRSAADGIERIRREADIVPPVDRDLPLVQLVERFESHDFPTWPLPTSALRRGDPNIQNFVQRPGPWASVDWEYSGWSDPAFEIADLITHAAYLDVSPERWAWVCDLYASQSPDPGVSQRIPVYTALMYGWWAARLARMLYQVPRGHDDRLAPWPDGWLDAVQARYEAYLARAHRALTG